MCPISHSSRISNFLICLPEHKIFASVFFPILISTTSSLIHFLLCSLNPSSLNPGLPHVGLLWKMRTNPGWDTQAHRVLVPPTHSKGVSFLPVWVLPSCGAEWPQQFTLGKRKRCKDSSGTVSCTPNYKNISSPNSVLLLLSK